MGRRVYYDSTGNEIGIEEDTFHLPHTVPLFVQNVQTNADRIRSMADEELAAYYFTEFFRKVPYCHENCPAHDDCELCLLEWLREGCE